MSAAPRSHHGLGRRLGRAFLLQAVAISVTGAVSVWAAAFTLEQVLIKQALVQESEHFWQQRTAAPATPPPDTRNLTGYLVGAEDAVPPSLLAAATSGEVGYHKLDVPARTFVYLSEQAGERLLLVFDGERVRELSLYFGVVPLALVLALLYFAAWLGYRAARRAVSPIEWLSREVQRLDPANPDGAAFAPARVPGRPDAEVVSLAAALSSFANRINAFVERERNFTRDASHELRSPLTVIRLATDMLLSEQDLARPARNSVHRIQRAADDMEELTEAFLLLARESEQGIAASEVSVNEVLGEEIERVRLLVRRDGPDVSLVEHASLALDAPPRVLSAMLGNLLRNAVNYTERGSVEARVGAGHVEIVDSGAGMHQDELDQVFRPFFRAGEAHAAEARTAEAHKSASPARGHGVGLTIVKRLSDRFGWPVHIDSTPGVGTRVRVDFPGSRTQTPS